MTTSGRFLARPQCDFDLRATVDFYGNRKLDGEAIVHAYAGLEGSDFASLYGATNPYDDFAECFSVGNFICICHNFFPRFLGHCDAATNGFGETKGHQLASSRGD